MPATETALIVLSLLAPAAAALLVWRLFAGRWRVLALLPLAMLALQLLLTLADTTCTGGGHTPWQDCAMPALTPLFNDLRGVFRLNLLAMMAVLPGLLILAGIVALIRRERHDT